MTAEQRGYDPTVVPASNDEITSMNVARDALPESDYRRKRIAAAMTRGWQIQKIRMREEDVVSVEAWRRAGQDSTSAPTDSSSLSSSVQAGVAPCSTPSSTPPNAHAPASSDSRNETGSADSGGRYFLVGKPEHHTDSPIGRGTRGYIAYDMKTGKFVFLRDSWRYETSKSEIKVYEQLHRNRVRHIATPICGGDVIGQDNSPQQTCAQEFDKDKKMPKYIHNRLVVEEIGISLLEFPAGRDLVVVMTNALVVIHLMSEAHEDAWQFAGVMHRDISVANILMLPDANPEAVGVSYKGELGAATQRSRSGTWQFMSALLLKGPGIKTHEVADDLESFMHVLNWLCLRFFKTLHADLRSYVSSSYDLVTKVGKRRTGGIDKYQAIKDGRPMANLEEKEGTPLKVLVESLATMCHVHYQAVDSSPSSEPGDDRPRHHPIITIGGASPDTYKWSDIYYPRTRKDEPKVKKDDPLVNHRLFIAAFLIACSAPASEFPAKEEDKFAFFKDIHTEHSLKRGIKTAINGTC
ncbi:hypothetical protein POSPLADRAFT_1183401 [Postia placenta MAD-698-R-SB12]|uniref:Fungal-type protein kinase domain-containing protein n=1 Tax=Postia placenta MAD-698-R-SB12 TaxID=670580 RepID=A0A1X6MTN1_9APHY|nr:hypothetical protein POSPLADRAFT_1183401 [Postia placenta MAD-698-R-SB12]OSX59728.1 hypothetical protein POSPLADRAFT_1183401 [Postia placenta MAD-698-R-SB12]